MPRYPEPPTPQALLDRMQRLCAASGFPDAEIARRLNYDPSGFHRRLNEGKPRFTQEDIVAFCGALHLDEEVRIELLRMLGYVIIITQEMTAQPINAAALEEILQKALPPALLIALPNAFTTLVQMLSGESARSNGDVSVDPALATLLRALMGQQTPIPGTVVSFGSANDQHDATINVGDVANGNIIKLTIQLPPDLEPQVTDLVEKLLETASGKVARQFRDSAKHEALTAAFDAALAAALSTLPLDVSRSAEVIARIDTFLHCEIVTDELTKLVDPRPDEPFKMDVLREEALNAGLSTDTLGDMEPDELIRVMVGTFYTAAAHEPVLQDVIKINLLRDMVNQLGALHATGERIAVAGETTVVLLEQSLQGQRDIHQTLEAIHATISTAPGQAFDVYRESALALNRVGAELTADASGQMVIKTDLIDENARANLAPLHAFLSTLRTLLLQAAESPAELAERERRYRALLIAQFTHLRLEGLSTSTKPILLPLEQVYVQLRAVAEVPEIADAFSPEELRVLRLLDKERERHGGKLDERDDNDDEELREARLHLDALRRERWTRDKVKRFPIGEALKDAEQRGLVILGDPGSGKTTLLQFLALVFAHGPERVADHLPVSGPDADRLPIFASLAGYDDMLNEQHDLSIAEFLPRYYDRQRAALGLAPVFENALAAGRALVLLDGLDEVVDDSRRRFVAEQTSVFIREAIERGNRVMLTSRIYGYRNARLTVPLPHVTVLDFRREEIEVFARQWSRALAASNAQGKLTPENESLALEDELALLREVRGNPGVERLAVNPLLLTMLALLRRMIGKLPQQRILLYDEYVKALLDNWQESRSGARLHRVNRILRTEAENVLIEIALWLQQHRGSGTATQADLLGRLEQWYLRDEGHDPNDPKITPKIRREAKERAIAFLDDVRKFSGMLIERGQNAFGFRHLTFQEYFAGRALARMDEAKRWELLKPRLHANRWREPILLAAARLGSSESRGAEATRLVTQILDAGSEHETVLHRDLFLATDCAIDDIDVALLTLRIIAQQLEPLLNINVPSIAIGTLRRLHELSQLRSGANERPRLPEVSETLGIWLKLERVMTLQPQLRVVASETLSDIIKSNLDVRAHILDHLANDSWQVRQTVIEIVTVLVPTDHDIRTRVLDCFTDDNWQVRQATIRAVAALVPTDPDSRARILDCFADDDNDVRQAAIRAVAALVPTDPDIRARVLDYLADNDNDVRQAAIRAVAALVPIDPDIRIRVLDCFADDYPPVRQAAIEAVAPQVSTDPAIRARVLDCFTDDDNDVRQAAITAVVPLITIDQSITYLIEQTFDHLDWRTRRDIMQSIESQEHIIKRFVSKICQVCKNIYCVEAGIGRAASTKASTALIPTDPNIRACVLDIFADYYTPVRQAAI